MLYQLGILIEDLQHVLYVSHPDKTLLSHRFWKKVARQHNMFHTTSNLPDFLGLPWSLHLRFTLDKKSVNSESAPSAAVIRSGKDAALAHGSRNMSNYNFKNHGPTVTVPDNWSIYFNSLLCNIYYVISNLYITYPTMVAINSSRNIEIVHSLLEFSPELDQLILVGVQFTLDRGPEDIWPHLWVDQNRISVVWGLMEIESYMIWHWDQCSVL